MNRVLYEVKCRCKEDIALVKKRRSVKRSEGKAVLYPNSNELTLKTFHVKYEKELSTVAKFVLNSLRNKYFYYAIDDILYLLRSNSSERDNILAFLYSLVLSLHNNFSINFFDIWIHEIHINKAFKNNKFLNESSQNFESFCYITVKFLCRTKVPVKKQNSLW